MQVTACATTGSARAPMGALLLSTPSACPRAGSTASTRQRGAQRTAAAAHASAGPQTLARAMARCATPRPNSRRTTPSTAASSLEMVMTFGTGTNLPGARRRLPPRAAAGRVHAGGSSGFPGRLDPGALRLPRLRPSPTTPCFLLVPTLCACYTGSGNVLWRKVCSNSTNVLE